MVPELGQIALITALVVACLQCVIPLWGAHVGDHRLMGFSRSAAYTQLALVAIAFGVLTHAFLVQDFSVAYVAHNSNSLLPVPYRFSAVWGAHEGSLLLWSLILALWTGAVALFSRNLPESYVARVLAVMGFISIGFLSFMLFTSNPFERYVPMPVDGNDLNPLLQDPGLIIHPPMLYVGYVGFSVAFAFAVAALLEGKLDTRWARWSRPWTNVAWAFLTLGIALGSWWAYYELGWGGWWFWDPVENASFMPWLAGTALIHSLAVTEKRGAFKSWTVLLAICAFSLSLLGTFLVRSGVITSVHAFASDPARGLYILVFLGIVTGGALTLYALRAPRVASGGRFGIESKESALLLNNVFFAVATFTVLVGTLYPLVVDAFGVGKISVGSPYFGLMFSLLMTPIVLLMPFGPFSRWQSDRYSRLVRLLVWAALAAIVVGTAWWAVEADLPWRALVGLIGAFWVLFGTLQYVVARGRKATRRVAGIPLLSRSVLGMSLAHLGVGVFLIGVTMTEYASTEKDLAIEPGQTISLGGYDFQLVGVRRVNGPNYTADEGEVIVGRDDQVETTLYPQKRAYSRGGNIMTEAAIDAGLTRDLYVSLGEPLDGPGQNTGAWSMRMYHKPFIRWIWLGALMMMLGGFVAAADARYARYKARQAVPKAMPAAA